MMATIIILMLTRPLLVGPVPHRPATRAQALVYSERALAFTSVLIVSLVAAGWGAIRLVSAAKAEYRHRSMENMQAMIEAAIVDKQDGDRRHERAE